MKILNEDQVEITIIIFKAALADLDRISSLEAQKGNSRSRGELVSLALNAYLEKYDPVRKAKRSEARQKIRSQETMHVREIKNGVKTQYSSREEFDRKIISVTVHQLHRRDGGVCIHQDEGGERCSSDRWVQIHHIHPVSEGGSNALENLATLCSFHHRLVHQMRVPRDRQRGWIPSSPSGFHSPIL